MAFCSFRGPGEDNPCGAIEWAKQESSMVPLLSCNADMSSWLKDNAPLNVQLSAVGMQSRVIRVTKWLQSQILPTWFSRRESYIVKARHFRR